MFRTRDIYFEMCRKSPILHKITDEERLRIQDHLKKMYQDIEKVCDQHKLTMMLAYGSALGAVRHQGFIPWDDDLDIFMPRKDYEQFINKYANELPDNYIVYGPNSQNGPTYRFAKVIDKNTEHLAPGEENLDSIRGVYVDIFPLDAVEKAPILNIFRKALGMFLMYTATSVSQYEAKSKIYKQLMSGSSKSILNYWIRQIWGFLFSFHASKVWYNLTDHFCRNSSDTGFVDSLMDDYSWRLIPNEIFFPPVRTKFEDIEAYVPHRVKDFLELKFGCWQELPPEDKREQHFVLSLKI